MKVTKLVNTDKSGEEDMRGKIVQGTEYVWSIEDILKLLTFQEPIP